MKTMKCILLTILLTANAIGFSQQELSEYKDIEGIYITTHWGDIDVNGTDGQEEVFNISAIFTDTSKQPKPIDNLSKYLKFEVLKKKLFITARTPKGFESIDIKLNIPSHLFLEIELLKGGNIYVNNMQHGIEINSLNGSVKLDQIGKYALVNAANGEINARFSHIHKDYPISLVTMNGGVTATLPKDTARDLRLISRKNGYVESDFSLETDKKIINLNIKVYAKQPIINTARINGGGALLFLSTENGPLAIKKTKS
ncbi:hypothetical protein [Winogradskyella sp.]|uniref:hypothetical protein n=1 Tax=Winogradskyella sp. TaxID=1883156 RepID=UPI00261BD5D5|nr:hypothetical protein [Winogradskyella sp.]